MSAPRRLSPEGRARREVPSADAARRAGDQPEALRRVWKIVDGLASDCEYPPLGDHDSLTCRRCRAVAEVAAEESKLLMRELLTLRQDGRV